MKKKIIAIVSAILVSLFTVSCSDTEEKNYNFYFDIETNIESSKPDAQNRFNSMMEIIYRVDYFTKGHSYFGTYSNACQQLVKDFAAAYDALDEYKDELSALFEEEEILCIKAQCSETGEWVGAAYLPKDSWK